MSRDRCRSVLVTVIRGRPGYNCDREKEQDTNGVNADASVCVVHRKQENSIVYKSW